MSGRGIVLPSAVFALALPLMLVSANARGAQAEDCLPKPTGATPQGQHWYYRIDHANQGRQCWHLAPERGADQQDSDQDETQTAAEPAPQPARKPVAAQTAPEPAAPPTAKPTGLGRVPATAAAPAAALSVAPVPWVNAPSLPNIRAFVAPAPSTVQNPIQSTNSTEPSANSNATAPSNRSTVSQGEVSAPRNEPATNAREQARRTRDARRQAVKEASFPSPAPVFRSIGEGDHVFALLMIIFIVLAVTGPALHFVERRRRRAAAFQPPRWARVVSLDTQDSPSRGASHPRSATRRPTVSPMRAPVEPLESRAAPMSDLLAQARSQPLVPDHSESFSESFAQSRFEPHTSARSEPFSESLVHAQSESLAPAQPATTDRLADALQQIVDRIQADHRPVRSAMRTRPSERASG